MALATLAGGLFLIRLCGEERLQRFFNIVFIGRYYQKKALTHEGQRHSVVSHDLISDG